MTDAGVPGAPRGTGSRERGQAGPRLAWIGVAWGLFAVLVVITVATVGFALGNAGLTATFSGGERVKAALDPADDPVIYVAAGDGGEVSCTILGPSAEGLSLTRPVVAKTVDINGVAWQRVFTIGIPAPGEYQVACEGEGTQFGIGPDVALGSLFVLVALSVLGFVAAVTTTIVVLVRRGSARRTR
jgi:hypothetical protein